MQLRLSDRVSASTFRTCIAGLMILLGESKLDSMPNLAAKLTPLKTSLTSALLQSLASPNNRKSTVVHLISLLARLKAGAAARTTFLGSRTEVMRKRVRMITFEGHVGMYTSDLAIVIFTGIKHTADWFLASFKENEVSSCTSQYFSLRPEAHIRSRFCRMGQGTGRSVC